MWTIQKAALSVHVSSQMKQKMLWSAHCQKKLESAEHDFHDSTTILRQRAVKNLFTVAVREILTISSPNWLAKINACRKKPKLQVLFLLLTSAPSVIKSTIYGSCFSLKCVYIKNWFNYFKNKQKSSIFCWGLSTFMDWTTLCRKSSVKKIITDRQTHRAYIIYKFKKKLPTKILLWTKYIFNLIFNSNPWKVQPTSQ